jgi:hypothetical protein
VVVLLFLLTLPAVTTRFYASDEVQFYAWLRSAAFDRDAAFDNEYRHFHDTGQMRDPGFRVTFLDETNEAGRRRNFTPIGMALLWAPFFAAGHAGALITGAPADGFSQPYITAVTVGSAVYGLLALFIARAIVRRAIGEAPWTPVILVLVGSPLVFYMYVSPGFSHAGSAFAVSLFLYAWLRVRTHWSPAGAAALGAAAALMTMVREQDAFFVAGPTVDFLRWTWSSRTADPHRAPKALRAACAGIAAGLFAYLPQLAAYNALNGHPGPTRDVARKMTWTAPHIVEVLWSREHGLFFWTPLALVGILGLVWLAAGRFRGGNAEARWIGAVALLMCLLQAYVSGSVESWTVAGSFGQRRFVALTPLLALGLAVCVRETRLAHGHRLRAAWAVVAVLCVWWNVGLMAQFGLHTMNRQRLTIAANARATFLELPAQLPAIVARYMTDRESFYERSSGRGEP